MGDKDVLFLLKPDFSEAGRGRFFCPDSAFLEGVLGFYPRLRQEIRIQYVDFNRPREPVVRLLGAEHQGCPALVLADPGAARAAHAPVQHAQGAYFLDESRAIAKYLARRYRIGEMH